MIVKMIILSLLDSSDDKEKEKIGVARPKSVHPMVVGRTDTMVFWCRRESKLSQLIGTG